MSAAPDPYRLQERISELEAELAAARAEIAERTMVGPADPEVLRKMEASLREDVEGMLGMKPRQQAAPDTYAPAPNAHPEGADTPPEAPSTSSGQAK